MKRISIAFVIISFIFSCTVNETCRNKTFEENTWDRITGPFDDLHFRNDDTLEFVWYTPFDTLPYKCHYEFDENCSGFNWNWPAFDTTYHYDIINNSGSEIWIKNGATEYHYQRQ